MNIWTFPVRVAGSSLGDAARRPGRSSKADWESRDLARAALSGRASGTSPRGPTAAAASPRRHAASPPRRPGTASLPVALSSSPSAAIFCYISDAGGFTSYLSMCMCCTHYRSVGTTSPTTRGFLLKVKLLRPRLLSAHCRAGTGSAMIYEYLNRMPKEKDSLMKKEYYWVYKSPELAGAGRRGTPGTPRGSTGGVGTSPRGRLFPRPRQ